MITYSAEVTGKVIKNEREKRKLSQTELGKLIYVSGKQISNYEQGVLMPPMKAMIDLCHVFNCELGYLLNEEEYSEGDKLMTAVKKIIGLDSTSVDSLIKITGTDKSCIDFGIESERHTKIINSFLSSPDFAYFYECLSELDAAVYRKDNLWIALEQKYTKQLVQKAMEYYQSDVDYIHDPDADKLDDIMYEIMAEIDAAIDSDQDMSYVIKVARYELNEAFEALINSMYPQKR